MIITYNKKDYEINEGKSILEALKDEIENAKRKIITCIFNNEVKSLNYIPTFNGEVQLIDYTHTEGKRVYVRGLMYIMAMAAFEAYPDGLLTVNYQLDNSMYCTFDNLTVTDEVVSNIKNKMKEIISKNLPIVKKQMSQEEAEVFYEKEKNLRGKLQIDMEDKEKLSLYYCKDYYNYFYGVMPISTGYMNVFDVVKYRDGFLVRYPSKHNPNKISTFRDNKKLMSTLEEYENIYKVLKLNTIYRLNKSVEADNGKETILLAEALHEKKISDIADKIANHRNAKVILIAGPSSSGKTTFAKRLRNTA